MARPKGTKYIETPEKMWELFEAYRKEVKSNPRIVYEFHGRDGEERQKPLERPLTMEGFENYCYDVIGCVEQYFKNQDNLYNDYIPICSRIRKFIREDQIEGGMVGQYNPSITQRLNGLTEKTETKQDVTLKSIDVKIVRPDGD
jgi:hypothetical protein